MALPNKVNENRARRILTFQQSAITEVSDFMQKFEDGVEHFNVVIKLHEGNELKVIIRAVGIDGINHELVVYWTRTVDDAKLMAGALIILVNNLAHNACSTYYGIE